MGFLNGLFSRFAARSGSADDTSDSEATLTCDSCGCDVEEEDMELGECQDCFNSEYTGPKYCCGMIYEEGEVTCTSCGEWL